MSSDKYPPEGSSITMTESSAGIRYSWTAAQARGLANVGVTAFLMVWLVGWAFGEFFAITRLLNPEEPSAGGLFMIVWLGGWTFGGLWCMTMIFLNLRPLRPAVLSLDLGEIVYETGTRRPEMTSRDRRNANIGTMFRGTRNKVHRVPTRDCRNLQLDRVGERLRLSFDHDSKRIEIGESLGEPDKEWLHGLLERFIEAS